VAYFFGPPCNGVCALEPLGPY